MLKQKETLDKLLTYLKNNDNVYNEELGTTSSAILVMNFHLFPEKEICVDTKSFMTSGEYIIEELLFAEDKIETLLDWYYNARREYFSCGSSYDGGHLPMLYMTTGEGEPVNEDWCDALCDMTAVDLSFINVNDTVEDSFIPLVGCTFRLNKITRHPDLGIINRKEETLVHLCDCNDGGGDISSCWYTTSM